jgi:hypothetical protein
MHNAHDCQRNVFGTIASGDDYADIVDWGKANFTCRR